ncbi:MAG: hypothetical protein C0594_10140, partial [Marinilabiliales bacterium]
MGNKVIILFVLLSACLPNQNMAQDNPFDIDYYDFVRYDKNEFKYFEAGREYERLFLKFNRLILQGQGQIKVLHIGDSHIQADILSGRMRQRM